MHFVAYLIPEAVFATGVMVTSAPGSPPSLLHNELLCFMTSKINVVPFEALVKICTDFYPGDAILAAKDLLWDTVITEHHAERRNIRRKNGTCSKEKADCEDILKALQVCDKEETPMPKFCAVDLNNLPPATLERMDTAVLLSQLSHMQEDMGTLKQAVKSLQESSCQAKAIPQVNTAPPPLWAEVAASPAQQPGAAAGAHAGQPPGKKSVMQHQQQQNQRQETQQQSQEQPQHQHKKVQDAAQGTTQVSGQPLTDDDGFTLVRRPKKPKTHRQVNVTGMNPSTQLKGVASPPKTRDLFVGRLDPSTLSDAVQSHVNWVLRGKGTSSVEEIEHCAAAYGYKGFKVTVPAEAVSLVMQAEKWPTHVSVKKYYQPKGTKSKASPVQTQTLHRSTSAGNISCV